ncbi:MAG: radical SAM protein [Acidobacteria bacterium]|nr:MAG: radical SAM protein [Acidobacteriota bacterium]
MSFVEVMRRAWRDNLLWSVLLELTYRCNLSCFFCYNDLGLRGTPLSTERYLELLVELEELQVMNLILSGGEPLAHPDFLAIGRAARERGFVLRIKTNGHAFRGRLARRIKEEIDPFLVEVSLHGASPASHDRQTRVAGSFERLLENLEGMVELGLRVRLVATLTRWNEDEVEGMFAVADRLGLPIQWSTEVTPRDDGDREPLAIAASPAGLEGLYRHQLARAGACGACVSHVGESGRQDDAAKPGPGKHCGAGSSTLAVDPYGNVYPCVQWRRPLGNLHRASIAEIWSGSPVLEEVRQQSSEVKAMVDAKGERGPLLSFCPGTARLATGSPLRLYPGARARADALQAVRATRKKGGT